jgi:hypothetical protein
LFKKYLLLSDIKNTGKLIDCDSVAALYSKELQRILDLHARILDPKPCKDT